MAGNYPNAPGPRMALDIDGTQIYYIDGSNNVTQLTAAQVQSLQDEGEGSYYASQDGKILVFFPEMRDLVGVYWRTTNDQANYTNPPASISWDTSADTTSGIDGTWTAASGITNDAGAAGASVNPDYRTKISAVNITGIKALRMTFAKGGANIGIHKAIHLYGARSAGQNPDRLRLWHPTLDQPLNANLDWGNAPRSSSADQTFRVKNNSSTKTASGINLTFDSLTDTNPTTVSQHLVSTDGSTFGATASIASLAPGAISSVVTVRRNTPANATLSLWSLRVRASATSWA